MAGASFCPGTDLVYQMGLLVLKALFFILWDWDKPHAPLLNTLCSAFMRCQRLGSRVSFQQECPIHPMKKAGLQGPMHQLCSACLWALMPHNSPLWWLPLNTQCLHTLPRILTAFSCLTWDEFRVQERKVACQSQSCQSNQTAFSLLYLSSPMQSFSTLTPRMAHISWNSPLAILQQKILFLVGNSGVFMDILVSRTDILTKTHPWQILSN